MLNSTEKDIFAILFAAGVPVELLSLAQALEKDEHTLKMHLENLEQKLSDEGFPVMLLPLADKYQLCTRREYRDIIKRALDIRRNIPLSNAAMEVLAIVAYNEPVTKSFIEQVRGVDSSSVVNSLEEKGLLAEAGRMDLPGRPVSYRTSANFLRSFGISSLEELPSLDSEPSEPESSEEKNENKDNFDQLDFSDI